MAWAIVSATVAALLVLSIVLVDPGPLRDLFERASWKRFGALVTIAFGAAWMVFGAFLAYAGVGPITNIVKLKFDGQEARARITRVTHWVERNDDTYYDVFRTEYVFQTERGGAASGAENLSYDPVSGLSGSEFDERYGGEYVGDEATPALLAIEYQAANPANNRVQGKTGIVSAFLAAIVSIVIGAVCAILGFFLCMDSGEKLRPKRAIRVKQPKRAKRA
jgi:hypothetical protein